MDLSDEAQSALDFLCSKGNPLRKVDEIAAAGHHPDGLFELADHGLAVRWAPRPNFVRWCVTPLGVARSRMRVEDVVRKELVDGDEGAGPHAEMVERAELVDSGSRAPKVKAYGKRQSPGIPYPDRVPDPKAREAVDIAADREAIAAAEPDLLKALDLDPEDVTPRAAEPVKLWGRPIPRAKAKAG